MPVVVAKAIDTLYLAEDGRTTGHATLYAVRIATDIQGDADGIVSHPVVLRLGDIVFHVDIP